MKSGDLTIVFGGDTSIGMDCGWMFRGVDEMLHRADLRFLQLEEPKLAKATEAAGPDRTTAALAPLLGRADLLPEFESIYPKAPLKYGGDDRSFDSIGVPTLWFNTHAKFMDFHTPLDTLGTLDLEKIVQCVKEGCRLTEIISKK